MIHILKLFGTNVARRFYLQKIVLGTSAIVSEGHDATVTIDNLRIRLRVVAFTDELESLVGNRFDLIEVDDSFYRANRPTVHERLSEILPRLIK